MFKSTSEMDTPPPPDETTQRLELLSTLFYSAVKILIVPKTLKEKPLIVAGVKINSDNSFATYLLARTMGFRFSNTDGPDKKRKVVMRYNGYDPYTIDIDDDLKLSEFMNLIDRHFRNERNTFLDRLRSVVELHIDEMQNSLLQLFQDNGLCKRIPDPDGSGKTYKYEKVDKKYFQDTHFLSDKQLIDKDASVLGGGSVGGEKNRRVRKKMT